MLDLKQFAQSTLKNETATDEEKKAARKAIRRINAQTALAQGRPKRPQRRDYENDAEHEQALKDFRSVLDKAAVVREASNILDDPDASVYMRRKARETLYGPDPGSAEPVKTAESKTPDTNQRSRLTSAESAEEQARAQAFLDALDAESVAVPARPAPQSVTPKPPIAPPVDPRFYCEQCRVPFKVCGCDQVICSLCLHPQSNCFPPCQNSRRRF
jgi:hypothetical protein